MNTETPTLLPLASRICAYLNLKTGGSDAFPVWTCEAISPEYRNSNYHLKRNDGLTLFLAGPEWHHRKGKLEISLSRPGGKNRAWVDLYNEKHERISDPSIGVSDTKAADQIAADIIRRLLSDAERVHKLALAKIEERESAANAHLETLRAIGAAAGVEVERGHNGEPRYSLYLPDPREDPNTYRSLAQIEVRQADCVHFVLDPDRAQALALIQFLKSPAYLNA